MKRTIKSFLAAAGLAFIGLGSLLTATPAHAVTITNITQNGITCKRHDGGTYPEDGHYYDCTTTHSSYSTMALQRLNSTRTNLSYKKVWIGLTTAPKMDFFVFENAVDQGSFLYLHTTAQQHKDDWEAFYQIPGVSAAPTATLTCGTRMFVGIGTGNYTDNPNTVTQATTNWTHSITHENGHCFDFLFNGSFANRPSARASFATVFAKDKAYMLAKDTNYQADMATLLKKLHDKNDLTKLDPSEVFAEIVALTLAGPTDPTNNILTKYFGCSVVYTQSWMANGGDPSNGEYDARLLSRCHQ